MDIHENDAELVRRAVEYIGASSNTRAPRWSHVGRVFGVGSTSSWRLCERLGFDPDEQRGGCGICGWSYGIVDGETVCECNE